VYLYALIQTVFGYLVFGAWAGVALALIYSAIRFSTGGREEGVKVLSGALLAAVVLTAGWTVVTAVVHVPSTLLTYYEKTIPGFSYVVYFAYTAAAVSIVGSAYFFLSGQEKRALGYFASAILIMIAVSSIPALGSPVLGGGGAFINAQANVEAVSSTSALVGLNGTVYPPNYTSTVNVNWGDGSSATLPLSNGTFTAQHNYTTQVVVNTGRGASVEQRAAFTITVQACSSNGVCVSDSLAVDVTSCALYNTTNPVEGGIMHGVCANENIVGGPLSGVILPVSNTNIFKLFALSPIYGKDSLGIGPSMASLYPFVEKIALGFIALFFAADVIWTVWERGADELTETIVRLAKDIVFVAVVILITPYVYNVFATILNDVASTLIDLSGIAKVLGVITGIIAVGVASGYFVPFAADIAAALLIMLIFAEVMAVLRFLLIGAAVVATPLVAVFWLFPPLRKVAYFLFELITGIMLSGVFAALIMRFVTTVIGSSITGAITIGLSAPFIFSILPNFLSFGGANVFSSLSGIRPRRENIPGGGTGGGGLFGQGGGSNTGAGTVAVGSPTVGKTQKESNLNTGGVQTEYRYLGASLGGVSGSAGGVGGTPPKETRSGSTVGDVRDAYIAGGGEAGGGAPSTKGTPRPETIEEELQRESQEEKYTPYSLGEMWRKISQTKPKKHENTLGGSAPSSIDRAGTSGGYESGGGASGGSEGTGMTKRMILASMLRHNAMVFMRQTYHRVNSTLEHHGVNNPVSDAFKIHEHWREKYGTAKQKEEKKPPNGVA